MITHVKFVSIPTTNQDRALAFYTEKLDLTVDGEPQRRPRTPWS